MRRVRWMRSDSIELLRVRADRCVCPLLSSLSLASPLARPCLLCLFCCSLSSPHICPPLLSCPVLSFPLISSCVVSSLGLSILWSCNMSHAVECNLLHRHRHLGVMLHRCLSVMLHRCLSVWWTARLRERRRRNDEGGGCMEEVRRDREGNGSAPNT
jgi:hypothetical protein